MHEDELPTDAPLVRRLLAAQFPHWAGLPVEPLDSSGTVNALYRLGRDLVVRLPRLEWGARALTLDREWLPKLAPLLPVEIPVPVARGEPSDELPWEWGVYPWLEGDHPDRDARPEPLAAFVRALHDVRLERGPRARRGRPLAEVQDESVRAALRELEGTIDVEAASAAWEASLAASPWEGPSVWVHGDLLPGNLLVRDGVLTGVIDWGSLGVGDPACDLIPAWGALPADARDAFRAPLGVDDATWARGRGWALSIGLIALPYYVETNPVFAETARVLIRETLAELG
ncbi:MAG TPA: aminoglycoside phosphotransferase family protein [Gaiellaceae bacterium]|nr:aminoglycoside phosphotransferase family protein [Gaiellaceae bacterium]